jgi:hypothetical protein
MKFYTPALLAAAALLLSATAHGQSNVLSPGATAVKTEATAVSGSSSNAGSASISAPNQQIINNDPGIVRYEGSYTMRNVPGIVAPALSTTLTETCHGSSSAGGAISGFGITIGSNWRDEECVRRLHARELRGMGPEFAPVAWAIMCGSDYVREAAKQVGKPCPLDVAQPKVAEAPAQQPSTAQAPAQAQAPVTMQPVRSAADNPSWCASWKLSRPSDPVTKAGCV